MNLELIEQLTYFRRVNVPKYIECRLQNTALKHLELSDMGKLRDRMDGQLYYDKLKTDIFAEYAFEQLIGIKKFDWEKRDNKYYKRKQYNFEGKALTLVTLIDEGFLVLPEMLGGNFVFVYVTPQNQVFVSGIATKRIIKKLSAGQTSKTIQINHFIGLIHFSSFGELLDKIE